MSLVDLLATTTVGAGWGAHAVVLRRRIRRARRDPLTGLWTRDAFGAQGGRLLARRECLVVIVDVNDFKSINDRYGHAAGDAALVAVADVLTGWAGPGAVAGRLGGDEFVAVRVIRPGECPKTLVAALGGDLVTTVRYETFEVAASASAGVAHVARPGLSLKGALQVADGALYEAKRSGGGSRLRVLRSAGTAAHAWRPRRHKRTGQSFVD
jgi:diguanylate cyclase (GGDEF)-like protein